MATCDVCFKDWDEDLQPHGDLMVCADCMEQLQAEAPRCEHCDGRGYIYRPGKPQCPMCKGTGLQTHSPG